ncbi:MAG: hypothetical protein CMM82_03710 [Rhodospirillales bacterium]|nr:hypothetical protein [Rhodospirillales bacterium]
MHSQIISNLATYMPNKVETVLKTIIQIAQNNGLGSDIMLFLLYLTGFATLFENSRSVDNFLVEKGFLPGRG